MDDNKYGYRYQLITGISLFKQEKNNYKLPEDTYAERSIYHFMKALNEKEIKREKEFKI